MTHKCPRCGEPLRRDGFVPNGRQRWSCRETTQDRRYCYTTTNPAAKGVRKQDGSTVRKGKAPVFKRTIGKTAARFIVTAAQNATPVHAGFVKALETACNHLNAELLVVPLRYKNPTSRWTRSQANEEVWAPEVTPYLYNQRKALNKNIVVLGDIKTQPTASSPLTGFEAITHGESAILGHTKLQLRVIPTPQNRFPKILTTTGACTRPNYTDSRAGKLGEFHHCLGAALVEVRGKRFHLRQLNADTSDGSFTDLEHQYTTEEVLPAAPALVLAMGDTHVDFIDPEVKRATFGEGGIVQTLRPGVLVWHDLLDGYSVNPHHQGNPFAALVKRATGRDEAEAEVNRALKFIEKYTPAFARSVVIPSNHDDFLRRWIFSTDWRGDPTNALFYLRTALAMAEGAKMGAAGLEYPSPFKYWADEHFRDAEDFALPDVHCLAADESLLIAGVEYKFHGHRGANGARGSRHAFRRVGVKTVIGHGHGPGIEEGCYQAGTSTRRTAEYLEGLSSWLQTHCIQYSSGKRCLVNIIEGEWRI